MLENNATVCKQCGQLKARVFDGRYPDGRNKRWRDDDGLLWSGLVCGSCNVKRSSKMMKRVRDEKKIHGI